MEAKGPALDPPGNVHTCAGARLCNGAHDFSGMRARACRWLGNGGGPERRRTVRRHKEPRNETTPTRGLNDGGGRCKIGPSLARRPASHSASMVARRRTRRCPSARRSGHPQMSGEGRSSPRWLLAKVKASVERRGAARRCGRRRRRRRGCRRRRCEQRPGPSPPSRAAPAREDGALPRLDPRLLHLLPTLDVTGGADKEQTPSWLGFEGVAPSGALIAGRRWDGRHYRAPDAWRPSAAADMAARPRPFHGGTCG
jgi:hypothetical protein